MPTAGREVKRRRPASLADAVAFRCAPNGLRNVCRNAKGRAESLQMTLRPFHLAFPVHDLTAARTFYGGLLGCSEGRSSESWVDFDFQGHQIVAHLSPEACEGAATNAVDGEAVPVRHFGLVLDMTSWRVLADRLTAANVSFLIEPQIRFQGEPGEQATLFLADPSGNAIEFKAFADLGHLFAR